MHVTGPGTGYTAVSKTSTFPPFMEFAMHSNEDRQTHMDPKERSNYRLYAGYGEKKAERRWEEGGRGKGEILILENGKFARQWEQHGKDSEERLSTEGLGTKKSTVRWELREREGGGEGVRPAPIASLWISSSGLYPEGEGV